MESLDIRRARRLALVRAGLLKPEWTRLPRRAAGSGKRARDAAHAVLRRFGYLQLDSVAVAGARSHGLVLLSRIEGFEPALAEALLKPGEPLFEYWGHEASWLPMELYPVFEFRRREYAVDPWWGDVLGEHREVADRLLERIRTDGPLRSLDLDGETPIGDGWYPKIAKRVARAFWSRGDLAIRERRNFQRSFDLAERVIPEEHRSRPMGLAESMRTLLERALAGHGWATTGTLARTWRLRNLRTQIDAALGELEAAGAIVRCALVGTDRRSTAGWIRPADLELAERAATLRPRRERGVLLSPFDPVLWDRQRVKTLFDFDQVLEIFKPPQDRVWGYYCLPVLAGDRLAARVDLKADRGRGRLDVLARHLEPGAAAADRALESALDRYARAVELAL